MRKFLIFLFSFLLGLALFTWIIKWIGWKDILDVLFNFSGYQGIVILGITLLSWFVGLWRWKFILKSQECEVSNRGLGEILFASFPITFLFTPTAVLGGEVFRAYSLKKRFFLPWDKSVASVAIERLLGASVLLFYLIFGAVSFVFLAETPLKNFKIIALSFIGLLVSGLVIFYFKCFKKESILKWIIKFLGIKNKKNNLPENIEKEIFHFFDHKRGLIWKGLGITFLKYFLILTRCWIIIFFLHGQSGILIALAIFFFVNLSHFFPFPADLGSLEALQVLAFGSLGLGAAAGVSFSFISRGADLVIAILGLIFLFKLGIKFFIENIEEKIYKIFNRKNKI